MVRLEVSWNLPLPHWSGNLSCLFSAWEVKVSIWLVGGYLTPAAKRREGSLISIPLGLSPRPRYLYEQQCFLCFCVVFDITTPNLLFRISTLSPNCKSFTSCAMITFQPSLVKWISNVAICLLRICEEARRAEITSASVTGFVLCVHDKKTCGIFVVLLWLHGNYFDSVCLEQGDLLVVLGLVGVNHWADLASPGGSTDYSIWHLTGQWLLHWQPPHQSGLPPTLLVVEITDGFLPFCAIFPAISFEMSGSVLFQMWIHYVNLKRKKACSQIHTGIGTYIIDSLF